MLSKKSPLKYQRTEKLTSNCSDLFNCVTPSFNIFFQGAAIAYVADLLKVPAIFVKAVTNIVDGDKPIVEEFLENLAAVADALDPAVEQVVNFINGNSLSELWQPNFTFQVVVYAIMVGSD